MICRLIGLLGLMLLIVGCTMPQGSPPPSGVPQSRCLSPPQRSQNYTSDRPLVYFFCVESP
jgi:hypothetical protein